MVIKFPKEQKARIIPLIQNYFEDERGEKIGNLAAEFLLDFFVKEIGPFIYNQAISDAQAYLRLRMADIEDGLYELGKPISR